jgi:alpha-N-arabinofuranosidase
MRKLAAMKPAFLRMPGGNYLEGNTINDRFEWKNTLGPIQQRASHQGPWGYRSDDGLGLLEFLEWCEDINMEPLLAVYAGYSLNGSFVHPGPDLVPYVQDALDEIQYVTGDTNTVWGAKRAADGHPAPFPLKYVEIGNEDFFDRSGSTRTRRTENGETRNQKRETGNIGPIGPISPIRERGEFKPFSESDFSSVFCV